MDNLDLKKVILYLSGILFFLVVIVIIQSIDTSDNKYIEKLETSTPVKTSKPSDDKNTSTPEKSVYVKKTPTRERAKEDLQKRNSSWKSNGKGALAIAETYKKAFVKAVNENDFTELDFMIVPETEIYKKEVDKIKKIQKEKIKLDFKSIKLEKYTENKNETVLNTIENIGIKKEKEEKFTYKDYKTKYILVAENQGITIKELSGGV
jgi:hypothetical protein